MDGPHGTRIRSESRDYLAKTAAMGSDTGAELNYGGARHQGAVLLR